MDASIYASRSICAVHSICPAGQEGRDIISNSAQPNISRPQRGYIEQPEAAYRQARTRNDNKEIHQISISYEIITNISKRVTATATLSFSNKQQPDQPGYDVKRPVAYHGVVNAEFPVEPAEEQTKAAVEQEAAQ